MDLENALNIIGAALFSTGAAATIIFGLSSWLGKVWAQRILEQESHKLHKELEETKRELDVIKETTLRFQNDKILTYRIVVDIVSKALATLDSLELGTITAPEMMARVSDLNEQRIRVYGYLAMLAPQAVMDAQDALMDRLLEIFHEPALYNWKEVRELAIAFLNEVRIDIGIDKAPIRYNGKL